MSSSNTRSSSHSKSKPKKSKEPRNVDLVEEFNTIIPLVQRVYALKESNAEIVESKLVELNNGLRKLIINEYFLSIYSNHVVSFNFKH